MAAETNVEGKLSGPGACKAVPPPARFLRRYGSFGRFPAPFPWPIFTSLAAVIFVQPG
jgi:hypothetical protein